MPANRDALSAWRAMLEVHALLTADMDARLRAEHRLPLQWYDVLVQLTEAGEPLRMKELAERTLFSRTECTRIVARMEAAGLVTKERAEEDGRGVYASPTPEGLALFAEAAKTHVADIEREFAAHLTDGEAAVVADALWRVVGAARGDEPVTIGAAQSA